MILEKVEAAYARCSDDGGEFQERIDAMEASKAAMEARNLVDIVEIAKRTGKSVEEIERGILMGEVNSC